ncbi:hemicentin-2 [Seriola aureovittata]|uniref:hemicentin-2 n=1 Tax=Seriola aureovittata TaxID=2871759 RepID=UPI0024BE718A|nr:hemicentin-2 [Seriola aureovittata]
MSRTTSFLRLFAGFILIATGVHGSCPIELNPPSVVVRYGDAVSVNCSTSETMFDGMGWEVTEGGISPKKVNHLTWSVKNLKNWDISPQCFLNPSPESTFEQCTKEAKIVLYTFPEQVSISSSSGLMREEEEYNFTCHIQHVAPVQNLTVRWYKEDTLIRTDTFNNTSKKPVDQSSVYSFTAKRQDNGVTLRCEAHMDLGPEGPQFDLSSQGYNITVHFGPDVKCPINNLHLQEGATLTSRCPVEGNPAPYVRWIKNGNPTDPDIPLSRKNAGVYILEAEGASSIRVEVQVFVLYGPELKCPSPYTTLEYVHHNFTCIVEGYPKPEITWYRDGEEVELPEILTRRDAGKYLITASNSVSIVNFTADITVKYPPSQIVELEDAEVEVGSNVSLKCSSMSNPRPQYIWNYYRTDNVMEENEDGVSRLLIINATAYNSGSYTCRTLNEIGEVSKTARVTVKNASQECPIEITPDRMVVQYQGAIQAATCKLTSSNSNLIERYWQVENNKIYNESWYVNTRKDWDSRPVCAGTFVGLGACHKPLNLTLYKMPDSVFISPVQNLSSLVVGEELQLQCHIIHVAPAQNLVVRWYKGNDTFEPHIKGSLQVNDCLPENSRDCDISVVRSPKNVLSTITITLDRKHNGAEFRCEAQMDLGPEGPQPPPKNMSSPLNITVRYKPIINATKLPQTIPVFRGYPEELICEADGHPPPKIEWHYSPDKVPHVTGDTLIVSEAGLYNCTATNEVDSVFYVVKVILKEDYLPLIAGFVAVTVVAISIVFVFIYSIYYTNTKMRRYSLKNPKLSTHNGNVAHNGWDMQFPMTKLSYGLIACAGKPVSANCQAELSPPQVVVKYRDTFSVNCSSSPELTEGMGWESSQGGIALTAGISFLTLETDSVTDWTIAPMCFFNLHNGTQCSEKLPVTVYKMPDSVYMHEPSPLGPMVEGTVYQLRCDIANVAPAKILSVYWHKGNKIINTQTFNEPSLSPVNKSSTFDWIAQGDDNGTQIWCEARLNFWPTGPKLPMMQSESHELIVLYPPKFHTPSNETQEIPAGIEMILNCTAKGNPMAVYSWKLPEAIQEKIKNHNGNQLILPQYLQFPGTYTCTASNERGSQTKYFTLIQAPRDRTTFAAIVGGFTFLAALLIVAGLIFVTSDGMFSLNKGSYLRGQPTSSGPSAGMNGALLFRHRSLQSCQACSSWNLLSLMMVVSGEGCSLILKPSRVVVGFGEPVSVTCEAARPVRVLGWESAISAAHTQQDLSVQWKVDSLIDWIEEPICYGVFFTAPRQCEEKLNLVLYKTPDSVSIRPVNHTGPMVEGKEYQLLCEVQNIAPVQYLTLRWYRGQTEVYNHSFADLTSSSPVQVSSILVVTPTKAENGVQYRCVAELELGPEGPQPPPAVTSEPLNASVYFPPMFLSPEPEVLDLTVGTEISLNCTATGNPTPVYSWQSSHPAQERMEDEAVLTSSSLLPGTYTCTASNTLEKKSKQFIVKAKTKGV